MKIMKFVVILEGVTTKAFTVLQKHQNFISERLIKDFNQLKNELSDKIERNNTAISDLSSTIQSQLLKSDKL